MNNNKTILCVGTEYSEFDALIRMYGLRDNLEFYSRSRGEASLKDGRHLVFVNMKPEDLMGHARETEYTFIGPLASAIDHLNTYNAYCGDLYREMFDHV